MDIFRILDNQNEIHTTRKNKTGVYFSMKDAKMALTNSVRKRNSLDRKAKIISTRCEQIKCENFTIVRYELVEKERHPI